MKSLLPIDENWTAKAMLRVVPKAVEIMQHNKLPDTSPGAKPFATLLTQQKHVIQTIAGGVKLTKDLAEQQVDQRIGPGLQILPDRAERGHGAAGDFEIVESDDIKAVAIAAMTPDDYSDYKTTGFLSGFLNVPGMLIDTVTPIMKGVQTQILNLKTDTPLEVEASLRQAQEILRNQIPAVEIPARTATGRQSDDNWYWKPRGEVMFQIEGAEPMEIPAWPKDINDRIGVSWSQEMTTFQHYEDQNTFKQSGPRTMDLLFTLHRAMWNGNQDSGDCEALIAYMESACYPDYDTQAAEPPRVLFTAGKSIRIYGIVTSMNVKYGGPLGPDVKYDCVDISISIKEESQNVLSTQAVRSGLAGWR